MAGEREIKIKLSAEGEQAIVAALRSVERAGEKTGDAVDKAGKTGSRGFLSMRGAAVGLNSILGTTSSLATSVFTGISAGGMLIGGAFSTAQGAVSGLKSALDELRQISIDAAKDIRDLQGIAAAMEMSGPDGAALADSWTQAIASKSFEAEAKDVSEMLTDIGEKVREAMAGSEDAQMIFTRIGVGMDDLISKDTGKPVSNVEALLVMVERAKKASAGNWSQSLIDIVGTGGVTQFSALRDVPIRELQDLQAEMRRLAGITPEVVAAADAVAASQGRLGVAFQGTARALLSGMGDSIAEGNADLTDFLVENRDKVREFGQLVGSFSQDLYARLMDFASQATRDLAGVGGDLANGPLKAGLDAILQAIDWLLDRLGELTAYLGQGQSVEWIDATVSALKSAAEGARAFAGDVRDFVDFIRSDVAPAVSGFTGIIGDLFDALGVESTGAQIGIGVALLAFGGTIVSVTTSVGLLIAKITGLTGALTAAGAATAPLVAIGGAAAGAAYLGNKESRAARSVLDIFDRLPVVAKERGQEAAAAMALAMQAEIDKKTGGSWLDKGLGILPGYENADERELEFQAKLVGLSRDEILDQMSDGLRAAGVSVSDEIEVDVGAGVVITGAEINARVAEQLAALPAQIDIASIGDLTAPITLDPQMLEGDIDAMIRRVADRVNASLPASSGGVAASSEIAGATGGRSQTVNLQINGQAAGTFSGSTDQLDMLQRAVARVNRGG
ncbi:hypothetical protein ACEPPZ_03520 [Paracoccus yeei]|uniref:hypothetical protein n=1 Tax=Paracoccus yeei TaxID=147645 RepID=UPI0037D256BA